MSPELIAYIKEASELDLAGKNLTDEDQTQLSQLLKASSAKKINLSNNKFTTLSHDFIRSLMEHSTLNIIILKGNKFSISFGQEDELEANRISDKNIEIDLSSCNGAWDIFKKIKNYPIAAFNFSETNCLPIYTDLFFEFIKTTETLKKLVLTGVIFTGDIKSKLREAIKENYSLISLETDIFIEDQEIELYLLRNQQLDDFHVYRKLLKSETEVQSELEFWQSLEQWLQVMKEFENLSIKDLRVKREFNLLIWDFVKRVGANWQNSNLINTNAEEFIPLLRSCWDLTINLNSWETVFLEDLFGLFHSKITLIKNLQEKQSLLHELFSRYLKKVFAPKYLDTNKKLWTDTEYLDKVGSQEFFKKASNGKIFENDNNKKIFIDKMRNFLNEKTQFYLNLLNNFHDLLPKNIGKDIVIIVNAQKSTIFPSIFTLEFLFKVFLDYVDIAWHTKEMSRNNHRDQLKKSNDEIMSFLNKIISLMKGCAKLFITIDFKKLYSILNRYLELALLYSEEKVCLNFLAEQKNFHQSIPDQADKQYRDIFPNLLFDYFKINISRIRREIGDFKQVKGLVELFIQYREDLTVVNQAAVIINLIKLFRDCIVKVVDYDDFMIKGWQLYSMMETYQEINFEEKNQFLRVLMIKSLEQMPENDRKFYFTKSKLDNYQSLDDLYRLDQVKLGAFLGLMGQNLKSPIFSPPAYVSALKKIATVSSSLESGLAAKAGSAESSENEKTIIILGSN